MITESDKRDIYMAIMGAKDPKKQITIEADLHGVSISDIEKVWKEESQKRSRINLEGVKRGPGRPKGTKPKATTERKVEEPKEPKPKTYERINEYPVKDIEVPKCVKEELMSSVEAMTEQINSLLKRREDIIDFIKRI